VNRPFRTEPEASAELGEGLFTLPLHDSDRVVEVFVVDRPAMTRARTTGDTIPLGPGMNQ